jgi:hypothetical protein
MEQRPSWETDSTLCWSINSQPFSYSLWFIQRRFLSITDYKASNERKMMNCKGCGRRRSWPHLNVLSQQLPGGTEKKTRKTSVRIAGVRAAFEPVTSRIRNRSLNHSTATLDVFYGTRSSIPVFTRAPHGPSPELTAWRRSSSNDI